MKLKLLASGICFGALLANASGFAQDKTKVAFILSTMQEERYTFDKNAFIKKAESLGAEVLFESANNEHEKQAKAFEKVLAAGAKAIVVQPVDLKKAVDFVKQAKAKNVAVVAYDRFIDSKDLTLYVTHDSFNVGVQQAKAAIQATNGEGKAVICVGQKGHSVADEITKGVETTLKGTKIKVVAKANHDRWAPEQCKATVLKALKGGEITIVFANNSGMADGAVQALKEAKALNDKTFIAGADATTEACKHIKAGEQKYDVLKPITPLAEAAADAAVKLAKGEKVEGSGKTKGVATLTVETQGFDNTNMKAVLTGPTAAGWEKVVQKCGL